MIDPKKQGRICSILTELANSHPDAGVVQDLEISIRNSPELRAAIGNLEKFDREQSKRFARAQQRFNKATETKKEHVAARESLVSAFKKFSSDRGFAYEEHLSVASNIHRMAIAYHPVYKLQNSTTLAQIKLEVELCTSEDEIRALLTKHGILGDVEERL